MTTMVNVGMTTVMTTTDTPTQDMTIMMIDATMNTTAVDDQIAARHTLTTEAAAHQAVDPLHNTAQHPETATAAETAPTTRTTPKTVTTVRTTHKIDALGIAHPTDDDQSAATDDQTTTQATRPEFVSQILSLTQLLTNR